MREILFRTWDEKKKKLIYFPYRSKMDGYEDALIFDDYEHGYVDDDTNRDDRELEQFTGLPDKNGTKIFEGDIILYCGAPMLVSFNLKYAQWRLIAPSDSRGMNVYCKADYEIIGNIHENPELLEVQSGK